MLQLLQPIWLWAGAGIIVPVLIHLWHIKKGKILKVGSVIFLQEYSKQTSTSLKISDWFLLILRCLLIILLAILMAEPQWQQASQTEKQKGWLLINTTNFSETYQHFKPTIDSLLQKNYELHRFNSGFDIAELKDSLMIQLSTSNASGSYWKLIKQFDEKLTGNKPIYVFTNNQLRNFIGNKEAINKQIKWFTYSPKDTKEEWLHSAYKTLNDSIKIVTKNSTETGTYITAETIAFKGGKEGNYTINKQKNIISLNTKNTILIDTSRLLVTIFSDKYGTDATYVKAAIDAIQQFTKKQIFCSIINDLNKLSQNADLVFWLSEIPLQKLGKKSIVIQYSLGKILDSLSWLSNTKTLINKTVITNKNSIAVWHDGFGNPLLSVDCNNPNLYYIHTHFNPSWNDFVWQENFPKLVLSILSEDYQIQKSITRNDRRIIDEQQLSFINTNVTNQNKATIQYALKDFTIIIWLLAFTIFCIERLVSFKTDKSVFNG